MRDLLGISLLIMLLDCTSGSPSKTPTTPSSVTTKDPCGATETVAPQPALVGVCRE